MDKIYNYAEYKNIVYKKTDKHNLKLDLIIPKDGREGENRPCAVFFHGGGWIEGGKEDIWGFPLIIDELCLNGFAVASVSYRLVGKGGGFYQSVEDCIDALRFLDIQDIFNIDPNRKAVFGISAGGYMALMSAFSQDLFGKKSEISAVCDMCAPKFICMPGNPEEEVVHPVQTQKFFADFLSDSVEAPLKHLAYGIKSLCDPARLAGMYNLRPNVLIVHGECDECVNPEASRKFYRLLREKGKYAEYLEVENSLHTFSGKDGQMIKPNLQTVMRAIAEFIIDNT